MVPNICFKISFYANNSLSSLIEIIAYPTYYVLKEIKKKKRCERENGISLNREAS